MKRLLIICAVVAVGLVSCAAPITKDDVLAYKSGFNENYTDVATSLGILNNEALPKFQDLAKELKTISAGRKFQELKEMHPWWVNSTEDTLLALNDIMAALEKMCEYNTRFRAMRKKYGIPVAE